MVNLWIISNVAKQFPYVYNDEQKALQKQRMRCERCSAEQELRSANEKVKECTMDKGERRSTIILPLVTIYYW
jgi:hypothetical protein